MLWTGHTDTPISGRQPKVGWEPGAAFFYNDLNHDGVGAFTLHPSRDFFDAISTRPFTLQEDRTYNFAVRVEQVGLYDRLYSLKVWEVGTAEPTAWTLQGVQTFSTSAAPETGSIYLNAHYFDVTFNDLSVTELPGRDIVQGTAGANVLAAVTGGDPTPGRGEIDVLAGYGGADVFVLGNASGAYYDDGVGTTAGTGDYAFLWDFTPGTDSIRLSGAAGDYTTALNMAGLPSGTAILRDGPGDSAPELVAILNGVASVNLNGGDFIYVGDSLIA
jgi:hypothetical protein